MELPHLVQCLSFRINSTKSITPYLGELSKLLVEIHGGSIDRTSYRFGTISSFIQHLQSSLAQLQFVQARGPLCVVFGIHAKQTPSNISQ